MDFQDLQREITLQELTPVLSFVSQQQLINIKVYAKYEKIPEIIYQDKKQKPKMLFKNYKGK